jgi:aspartyl-tRNA(Asn)/glutamyl-tRNA(Gln) amidotransferase subunit A
VQGFHSLTEVKKAISQGDITLPGLVNHYLKNIDERKSLNAFLEVYAEEALQQAVEIQEKIQKGNAGRLAGMVIGIKDNICYKAHKVSASSKILEGFESLFSATAVEKLLAEDAIIIGRLNCDEFAMGSSNENSAYGIVRNPVNEETVPGGSSGGSAAAVAADLCLAALGSDTGGSIRQPASLTGTVGLKPSYGRISRWGLIAYASSFDQIGPITRSVADAALLLEIMAGTDGHDSTASSSSVDKYSDFSGTPQKHRIAIFKEALENESINPEVRKRMKDFVEELKENGHEISVIDFPELDFLVPTYYVLTTAEASSNLARFDGIHYGYRSPEAAGVDGTYKKSRSEGFGKEVKRRIMLGTFVLSAGYYDAYFGKAQSVRRMVTDKIAALLENHDFVLTPTTTDSAFKFGENVDDPIAMYLQDIFTVLANLVGMPAISLPLGRKADGMPFGIQLMSNRLEEKKLLDFSAELMGES